MDNNPFSPLSVVFPGLPPVVVKFVVVDGGIEIQLYQNNQLLKDWHASDLRGLLPELLIKWIDDHQLATGPQPYPLVKPLWQSLVLFASKKFLIDASALAELEEVSQPRNFTLVWTLNRSLMRIEGHYEGADRYLGMGWFQNGKKVWALSTDASTIIDAKIKNHIVPIQQGKDLLDAIIPALRIHLSNRVDFQYITDFTPQVTVLAVNQMRLVLGLQSNYSSLLPISTIPQQQADILLADQAIIQFPYQALTPAIIDLLSSKSSVEIFGTDIPVFINEQLPIWQKYRLISADMVATITQSHPIVSLATLTPTISYTHVYEQGIGKYAAVATYQYQHHVLDMMALLVAHQQHQRFVQQHGIWFEWPNNSESLFAAIQRQLVTRFLRPEEVMGLDDRYAALVDKPPTAHTIQLYGTGLVERGQEVLEQLKYHGIPGCIVGEAGSVVPMFITFCENLVRDNQQARILWLVPSTKKESVTRAIDASTLGNYLTVAPQETLQPALMSRLWTVVIFYEIEQLLNRRLVTQASSQLRWNWAFASATSRYQLRPETMPLLHIPEQYYERFCAEYIFDVQKSIPSTTTSKDASTLQPAQPVLRTEPQPATASEARKIMVARILPLEEVMGLDDRYAALVNKPLTAHTIQLHGATIIERGQEVLEQLKYHGIPGCIVGEAGAVVPMFVTFCENLVRDNQQARILWLVPSTKKGSVTRAIDASTLGNYSTVAPQETLQPALMSRLWTVVIFYEIDQLLNRRLVTQALSQLSWNWAFASATSRYQLTPAVMPLLHISENYYERFCAEYIFDVQKSIPSTTTSKDASTLQPAQPVLRTESQPVTESEAGKVQISVPPPLVSSPAPQPMTPTIQQNAKKIQSDVPSALIPSLNITFWEQARQWKDISHGVVPFVPCQRSYPIYTDMDTKELQWYFYWRTEIRHDRYPPTDISYIVMHVYEALECIGFTTPELACVRLRALWIQYRASFPQLDASLIPWIADFCVVHKLAFTAMHWYASLLSVPHCTVDERFIAEAWFRLGGDWERMPSAVLYSLAGLADPLPLNQDSQSNQLVEGIGGVAVASVENFLRSQQHVPNLLTLYGGGGMYTVKRFPFWGAVTERSYDPITVAEVNGAFNSVEFRRALEGILKYAAYLERKSRQNTTESFAPTIEVSWQEAIEAILIQKSLIPSRVAMGQSKLDEKVVVSTEANPKWSSARRTIDLNQAYEQLQERLSIVDEEQPQVIPLALPPTPVAQSRPATKREAEDLTISQRTHVHTQIRPKPHTLPEPMQKMISPAIHLDLEAIAKLREDSEQLQGRLLINAEEEAAQEVEPPIVMSDPAPASLEMTVPVFVVGAKITSMPEVDEEWQIILQQWQPEHWEVIRLLYEEQPEQLTAVERKVHRPVSLLIDELNLPVDEQLGDLLVDPDTRTISQHLRAIVGTLVNWYLSSEGR